MAIQLRRGISSDLIPANILEGELVYSTDTGKLLVGDGAGNVHEIQTELSQSHSLQLIIRGYATNLDALTLPGAYKTMKGEGTPTTYPSGTSNYNGWLEVLHYQATGYPTGITLQRWTNNNGEVYIRVSTVAQPSKASDWSNWSSIVKDGSITTAKLSSDLQNKINNVISTTTIGGSVNIDNLYGSSNYGVYYALGATGTLPDGETHGILWVFDGGGGWARQVWLGNRCHTRLNASTSTANWGAWSNQHLLYDGYTGNLNNLNERKHCGFYSLSEYFPVTGRPPEEKGGILAVSYDSESYGVWQTFLGKKIWRRHHDNSGWGDWQTDTAIKTMTQAEYDALTEYDPDVVYIVGD